MLLLVCPSNAQMGHFITLRAAPVLMTFEPPASLWKNQTAGLTEAASLTVIRVWKERGRGCFIISPSTTVLIATRVKHKLRHTVSGLVKELSSFNREEISHALRHVFFCFSVLVCRNMVYYYPWQYWQLASTSSNFTPFNSLAHFNMERTWWNFNITLSELKPSYQMIRSSKLQPSVSEVSSEGGEPWLISTVHTLSHISLQNNMRQVSELQVGNSSTDP